MEVGRLDGPGAPVDVDVMFEQSENRVQMTAEIGEPERRVAHLIGLVQIGAFVEHRLQIARSPVGTRLMDVPRHECPRQNIEMRFVAEFHH